MLNSIKIQNQEISRQKQQKRDTLETLNALDEGREISQLSPLEGIALKTLAPKQMLQRLPIALAQVKISNTSENLLFNEIHQIIFSLYRANKTTEKYTTIQ